MFTEIGKESYVHNPLSLAFAEPSNRGMFKQMYDFSRKDVYALPGLLASIGRRNPVDYDNTAFQYGHKTDLGLWEYLKQDPERLMVFNNGMRSLATVGNTKISGPYPFDERLEGEPCGENEVLTVHIGGKQRQALEAIRKDSPNLKGRMASEGLPNVIEDTKAHGIPDFIEPVPTSFFEPQSIHSKSQ